MSVLLAALALPWLVAGAAAYVLLYAFRSAGRAGKFIAGRISRFKALQALAAQERGQGPDSPSDATWGFPGPIRAIPDEARIGECTPGFVVYKNGVPVPPGTIVRKGDILQLVVVDKESTRV